MKDRHSSIPGIEWRCLDFRDMDSVASGSVDVAFDKRGLDAMIHGSPWNLPKRFATTRPRTCERYVSLAFIAGASSLTILHDRFTGCSNPEVDFCVSFRQPHFTRPLLQQGDLSWRSELKSLGHGSFFEYYGYIMIKS